MEKDTEKRGEVHQLHSNLNSNSGCDRRPAAERGVAVAAAVVRHEAVQPPAGAALADHQQAEELRLLGP